MTRRRSSATRRWAIGASALVALALASLAAVNAAQLNLTGSGVAVASAARCTNGPIAATGGSTHVGSTFTSVQLSSVAAACAGKSVQVTAYDSAGAVLATGSGAAAAGTFDIATTNFPYSAVAGVALLFDTWGVPATWTVPIVPPFVCIVTDRNYSPLTPTQYCTPTVTTRTAGNDASGFPYVRITFTVGLSNRGYFILTADFGSIVSPPGFLGVTPKSVAVITLTAPTPYACSGLPMFTFRGRDNVGGTRVFTLYETTHPNYLPTGGYTAICRLP